MTLKQMAKQLCPPILWKTAKKITPPIIVTIVWKCFHQIRDTASKRENEKFIRMIMKDKDINSTMQDGLLRIRITNRCNARCRYCGIRSWPENVQKMDIDPKILYEYCRPLYEQIKILLLTGGDPLITKESLPFARFMSTEYPAITLYLETNGIAFNDEWQWLAMNNLMKVHISVNASNEEVFEKGCWNEGGGIYRKIIQNIRQYMALLREHKLEVFAPDVSMVINKDTAHDVRDFVRFSLEEGLHHCMFFFDYTENDMAGNCFGCPDTSRPALKELMKLERVLAKKFFVYFRLWIPLKETEMLQPEVEDIPLDELRTEYAEILKIAESRSMKNEYKTRQRIRKLHGKKEFFFDEDWTPTIRQIGVSNKQVCFAPFKELDIYPDNKFECCGWIVPRFKIKDVIRDNKIDWNSVYNSFDMRKIRYDMLHDDFAICLKCCPLNSLYNAVCSSHKYGYDRGE